MLGREPQVRGELGEVVQDAGDRPRVATTPLLGERLGASASLGERGLAGDGGQVVEDPPEAGLDQVLVGRGDLGQDVADAMKP